jgi:preprotein translocase SecF subunit
MRFPIRILPNVPNINFIGQRHIGFAITLLSIVATIVLLFTKGLNYGIDFTGGVVMEVRTEQTSDIGKMRDLLETERTAGASLQSVGDDKQVMIRLQPKDGENQNVVAQAVREQLDAGYGAKIDYLRVDYVGPQVGQELINRSILAGCLSVLAMMLYLWFRFEWQYGVGGMVALASDAVVTVGFFSLSGLEFNLTSVAAVLTVIGYSINDKVVIYDRIRENLRKFKVKPINELLNLSINETLARTFLTGGTVLMALTGLVGLGGEVLRGFSVAMVFGVIAGTYSSIYVSANILYYLNLRNEGQPDTVEA